MPRRCVRAAPKEIVIGGPAGAAKYFNADLFPVLEKKLDCKVLYEGTNSLTNLQKMQADKAAPKISVVIMDDPVMLPAAAEGLITQDVGVRRSPISASSSTARCIRTACGRTISSPGPASPIRPSA